MSTSSETQDSQRPQPGIAPDLTSRLSTLPWWLLVVILLGLLIIFNITSDEKTSHAFRAIVPGLIVTLRTALIGFSIALLIGLFAGLGRTSKNPFIYNIASFYVEVVRGVPILVLLLYVAFVGCAIADGRLEPAWHEYWQRMVGEPDTAQAFPTNGGWCWR